MIKKQENWRTMRRNLILKNSLTDFQKEFRKHMATFITGAFSFVAALLWRDAIIEVIKVFEFKGDIIFLKFLTATIVSVIAIIVIISISKLLRVNSQ